MNTPCVNVSVSCHAYALMCAPQQDICAKVKQVPICISYT